MEEVWRPVVGYEGLYEVSNLGRIRSLDRYVGKRLFKSQTLKPKTDRYGYLVVDLRSHSKHKSKTIHRLVAEAFLPNPGNLPQVNHKNEDKTDNRVENLEWCSCEYNINYGTSLKRRAGSQSKTVYQYTLDGILVNVYPSTNECERQTKYKHSYISKCCNGEWKQYKGFRWSY